MRLWPWKARKNARPAAGAAPAPPAPAAEPRRPQTGDDLRKAFLEKLEARAEEKQA